MEKVVYFLGAGFSAPLGLPLMSNFLVKSKDQYFANSEKYSHFQTIFKAVDKLSVSKNYYEADLFNIEEILSILEMQSFLGSGTVKKKFIKYIIDVIDYHTPDLIWSETDFPSNWHINFLGSDPIIIGLCVFAFNLLGLSFYEKRVDEFREVIRQFYAKKIDKKNTEYSVISLNYDLLLENVLEKLNKYKIKLNGEVAFNKYEQPGNWTDTPLCKLHGCVGAGSVIPPTWAKGDSTSVKNVWKNAFKLLSDTNHIRFIGYSLPVSDAYIKYLLKAAIINCKHLKTIDVVCLDWDESMESHYRKFFKFNDFRFKNGSTEEYFKSVVAHQNLGISSTNYRDPMHFDILEKAHSVFMEG